MRVCLISVEIFAWGKYGGFGRDTRIIGQELVKRGLEVSAVVPRRSEQKPEEDLDGIRVLSFQKSDLLSYGELFRQIDADIYHSMEPSISTFVAMRAVPQAKHAVTFLDPRTTSDWLTELRLPSVNPIQVISNWVYEDNPMVTRAIRNADGLYVPAHFLAVKAKKKYGLNNTPGFLPTPVAIPENIHKATKPTVCYISRWDRRKRPELFLKLAEHFPQVRFVAVGASRDLKWDNYLREKYSGLQNLELLGFIDQFSGTKLWDILSESWILINTAAREGLPNAMKEGAAHACAILSSVDPDGFASRFGYFASQDDFIAGLEELLQNDNWRSRGQIGRAYVRDEYNLKRTIDMHLQVYESLTGGVHTSS